MSPPQPCPSFTSGLLICLPMHSDRILFHSRNCSGIDPPTTHPAQGPGTEPWIPEYVEKFEEPLEEKRARLMYQSRKRGMLENGLLLGSFASKHLASFDEEKLALYDR